MTSSPDDDALLAELGRVLRERAGPPPQLLAAAKDLFGLRALDAELASLTYDSLLDAAPAAVRSTAEAPRTLTFEADGLTIELEIDTAHGHRRLIGQLVPAAVAELTVSAGGVESTPAVDDFGRFVAPLPPEPGRVTLRAVRAGRTVSAVVVA